MEHAVQTIPDSLIYEVTEEGPIYYRGYRDCLTGLKTIDELIGSSLLQSAIITDLLYALAGLRKEYKILSNEVGIQLSKGRHRAADIAIVRKDRVATVEDRRKYLSLPPDIVIEVDIKADLEIVDDLQDSLGYIDKKTKALFDFGVKKVIWILTDTKKVVVADAGQPWALVDWHQTVQVTDQCAINVKDIVDAI